MPAALTNVNLLDSIVAQFDADCRKKEFMKSNGQIGIRCFLLAAAISVLAVSCGENGTDSRVAFTPGVYKGIYRVVNDWQGPNEEIKVDTVTYTFIRPDTFRMVVAAEDKERRFCDVSGTYVFTGDSLFVTEEFTYPQICNPDEIPEAHYGYTTDSRDVIFRTVTTPFYREIRLWVK